MEHRSAHSRVTTVHCIRAIYRLRKPCGSANFKGGGHESSIKHTYDKLLKRPDTQRQRPRNRVYQRREEHDYKLSYLRHPESWHTKDIMRNRGVEI